MRPERKATIRVRVTGTQQVRYDQEVLMTEEEWSEIHAAYEAGNDRQIDTLAEMWIDLADISDGGEIEDTEFRRLKSEEKR